MRRPLALGFLVASGLVLGLAAPSSVILAAESVPAAPEPAPADELAVVELLDRARDAAQRESYEGILTVEWRDGPTRHSESVPVRSAGGVLRLGDEVVGHGARRMVHENDGWLSLWGREVAPLGPSPMDKYHLTVAPGPEIAGRATDVVSVQLTSAHRPRERLYFDRDTGLLLRRELLDSHGEPYRSVAFTSLTGTPTIEVAALGGTPRVDRSEEPSPARHLKAPFKLKSRIGNGYRRVGAYKVDGVVHQFYSDGLHGLSVFEQRGQLTRARTGLPGKAGEGRPVEIAGHTMRAYSASVGEAVVWESDGVVYTAVTDAPWSDLVAAVEDLPHADPPGRLRRVAQAVVSLFRWR